MDQKDVQTYALDLYRFLLLRRLESLEEGNIQPTRLGCEPESRFSDVVGKAVLTLCHREQSSYWTWFVRDKDYMLRDSKSFLLTAAVYAEFLYKNSNSPSKVDSLLRFSAVILEMVIFASVFGQKDYIFISPIIWEQAFELFFRVHLSGDLSVLHESAEELASVYDNSECETCDNGKIKVKEGWLNATEQSQGIKSLLLDSSPCSEDSDLRQSKDADWETKTTLMKDESDCKNANGSSALSDVEVHGSKEDSVTAASGEKDQEFRAVSELSKETLLDRISPVQCTDADVSRRGLDWLELYVRNFQTSSTRESFEEFSEIHKHIYKAFKTIKSEFPKELLKFRNLNDEFSRWTKLNSEFTKKAHEVRIMAYHLTEDSLKRKKGEQSSSDSDTDAEEDPETVQVSSASKVRKGGSVKGDEEGSDERKVKEKVDPDPPVVADESSAAGAPPRPLDLDRDLEAVPGFSLDTRAVERCKRQLWQYDLDSDSSNPRSPIKRTLSSFASLKRRKVADSSRQESSAPGGSTPEILHPSLVGSQSGTESSGSKQFPAQPNTTEKLLPESSVPTRGEILAVSSDVRPRMSETASGVLSSSSEVAQASGSRNPRHSSTESPLLTELLLRPSPEPAFPSAELFSALLDDTDYAPSDGTVDTENEDSEASLSAGCPLSNGSLDPSGPSI